MIRAQEIVVYTDGACLHNPGPGGWAAVLLFTDKSIKEIYGTEKLTTNNRMELTAVIKALESLEARSKLILRTDSLYVKNGITTWINKWRKNNWKTVHNEPVKNIVLWQDLLRVSEKHSIDWQWVKGHSKDFYNDRADRLARNAISRTQTGLS